ncbi:MAG TPA: hypothetical protein VEL03_09630, partial [Streptosporangiaceae bacterium]|nr:hypothetical protein [Streptosporangiaceae bacterium]
DVLAAAEGHSLLLITHEFDYLDQMDEIIVLQDGRVTERGTHQQLMTSGGLYQVLRNASQSGPSRQGGPVPAPLRRAPA